MLNRRITIVVILALLVVALVAELVIPSLRPRTSENPSSSPSGQATSVLSEELSQAGIAEAKASLGQLKTALEAYRADNNSYPTDLSWTDGFPLTPSYLDPNDWSKILGSVKDIGGTISLDDYSITAHARDQNGTAITLTPRGIYP
ncbi:MAG: type II secretion system protein GspG [Coprothermobacterota bacterium]|nr:type II secretion system protein GspG [Coprothermobacterota bacterium]